MGRPKKTKEKTVVTTSDTAEPSIELPDVCEVVALAIQPLSIDYPSEGLNDMARKINELVGAFNALQK